MTDHLKNLIQGMRQVLVLRSQPEYVYPARQDGQRDAAALAGDMKRIGADMRAALEYGEQVDYRKS